MTKYTKTAFTSTTLEAALKVASQSHEKAVASDGPLSLNAAGWLKEIKRLQRAIWEGDQEVEDVEMKKATLNAKVMQLEKEKIQLDAKYEALYGEAPFVSQELIDSGLALDADLESLVPAKDHGMVDDQEELMLQKACLQRHMLQKAMDEVDLLKDFADDQNEEFRTTDMKKSEPIERLHAEALWFHRGIAYARTESCGCCSETMSSDADDYDFNKVMTNLESLAEFVETEEARVRKLRKDYDNYCAQQENG
tara:strand:- start:233 stop:988 length:756 start_codon:yes stop_codon:yes gene_type:complete